MKIKVSPKDLAIFSVFCVFLLYFSAIAVLNVVYLINEGVFYGLNPFKAFTGKYIFITIFVFLAVLVSVFLSVSSSIFSKTKGFGFSFGEKEEKGYSRWLDVKEMKKGYKIFKVGVKDVDASAAGIVLINDGKNMWIDDSELHTLVIGVTGSGKTTAVVDPLIYSLCKHRESMIFTDPKGEIYTNHAELLKARGYKIVVLNFRNPNLGNSWNPLTLPYQLYHEGNVDKAIELIDDVANNIVKEKNAPDPFWQNSASDYFAGCALGLLEDAKEEEVNLNSINLMTTVGEEKFGPGSTYIKEYFGLKGEQSNAYTFASNTINSPGDTKGGIISTFRQRIRLFSSRENLSEMLSYSDFNMRDIGKMPTAVFMVIHDEKTTYHALATIFIKQCYETLISVAQESGGKLPIRTNFILDEFANMPALKDVTTMVTAARSRLIRFTFIIQNFAQLNDVYGKEDAETIRSNCGNLIYLLTTELAALEEISKLCGEVKTEKDGKTENRPLVTVSDLQKMKLNEVIILRNRMHPFKTQLAQAFNVDWGDKEFGKAEFTERQTREIKYFDIKEFVKVRKRSKMGIDEKNPGMPGAVPDFASLMGGGLNSSGPSTMPRIPTFEEFMAARNAQKKDGMSPDVPKKPMMPSFDVDSLVKRIDAKIAELEAQEKAEEAKKNGILPENQLISNPTNEVIEKDVTHAPIKEEIPKKPNVKFESVSAEPVNQNFNPFIQESPTKTPEFINKDIIQGIDSIETGPINAPKIENPVTNEQPISNEINTFSDLMNQGSMEKPVASQMEISHPVETNPIESPSVVTQIPEMEQKPLTGVVDPTKELISNKTEPNIEDPQKFVQSNSVSDNDLNNSQVVSNKNDDAFFDDFFDND